MIGLIFGEKNFPKEILKKVKKRKVKYLIIDLTKKKIFKKDRSSHNVSIGQFGKEAWKRRGSGTLLCANFWQSLCPLGSDEASALRFLICVLLFIGVSSF